MPLTIVLSVGLSYSALNARTLLLQSAGYIVLTASSVKEAVGLFQSGDFDLILLCHSIPDKDRERLTCLIRASGSLTPVISVAESAEQHDVFPDATLDGREPDRLLMGIKKVLAKTARDLSIPDVHPGAMGRVQLHHT